MRTSARPPSPISYLVVKLRHLLIDIVLPAYRPAGVRNSVGFDWHPQTGELYFTVSASMNFMKQQQAVTMRAKHSQACTLDHAPYRRHSGMLGRHRLRSHNASY
jgi:hypothetical protein